MTAILTDFLPVSSGFHSFPANYPEQLINHHLHLSPAFVQQGGIISPPVPRKLLPHFFYLLFIWNSISEFLPIVERCISGYFFELPDKIRDVIISAVIAYICNRRVFIDQTPACLTDPYFIHKLNKRFVFPFPKIPAKGRIRKTGNGSSIIKTYILMNILNNKLIHFFKSF